MATLLTIWGTNAGVKYELAERTRIGRLGENEIQVSDPNVSRVHAEIIQHGDVYTIVDRGSKNGVLVNGQEVTEKDLRPNDEIVIGNAAFVYDATFNILNSHFSSNAVYVTDSAPVDKADILELVTQDQDSAFPLEKFKKLAGIFGGTPAPLPDTGCRITNGIRDYFNADCAIILVRDTPSSPLYPLCVAPNGESVIVSKTLLARADEKKVPVCILEALPTPSGFNQQVNVLQASGADNKTLVDDTGKGIKDGKGGATALLNPKRAYLCAPMVSVNGVVQGMLIIRLSAEGDCHRDNLIVLQTMTDLAMQAIQSIRMVEQSKTPTISIPLDPDTRTLSTRSLRMQEIYNAARRSADGRATILITGEGGTGKETLARFIHENGPMADGPFVTVNCSAIPADEFEYNLFGYEPGAFEGANTTYIGAAEQAQGGTLYFSEINELDITLQPKLLRFLQDRAFTRKGGVRPIASDTHVVASTQADLAASVRAGRFREDLWYRLNVIPFHVPPLRERREDIRALVEFFVNLHNRALNKKIIAANDAAISLLQKYDWPGNMRELDNAVERAVMLADSRVLAVADFVHIEEARKRLNSQSDLERKRDTKPLAEVERQHIIIALKKHNFNQARAAEALGLHRNTLRNKIIEYGIEIAK